MTTGLIHFLHVFNVTKLPTVYFNGLVTCVLCLFITSIIVCFLKANTGLWVKLYYCAVKRANFSIIFVSDWRCTYRNTHDVHPLNPAKLLSQHFVRDSTLA